MPIDEKIRNIIDALAKLTEREMITWDTTPDEETFRTSVPRGIVRVAKIAPYMPGSDPECVGEDAYLLTLLDESGRVVEQLRSSTPADVEAISNLHTLARRSALRTDDFLSEVLQELNSRVKSLAG